MEIVYRIYDNILASGVEAIFAFSLVLLHKNEQALLALKFDEILAFLNNRIFEVYEVRPLFLATFSSSCWWAGQKKTPEQPPTADDASEITKVSTGTSAAEEKKDKPTYDVDEFVNDAVALRITPFMLDTYAREYEDMVRAKEAQAVEMDELRTSNRTLSSQVWVWIWDFLFRRLIMVQEDVGGEPVNVEQGTCGALS
jgi:hypothetical protein